MDDGIEVFVTNRRKDLQPDALEFKLARTGVMRPAVNRHVMAARNEARRQMFGEGFKSAVIRWYSTRSENRDAHKIDREGLHQITKAGTRREKKYHIFD